MKYEGYIVHDILDIVYSFECVDSNFMTRTLKVDAHLLADLCFDLEEGFVWINVSSDWIS